MTTINYTAGTGSTFNAISAGTNASPSSDIASVQGGVASLAADSGNPVKVGGVYNSSLPSPTTGERCDLQVDNSGRLLVNVGVIPALVAGTAYIGKTRPTDGTNDISMSTAGADGASNTVNAMPVVGYGVLYNGTTWDRQPGDKTNGAYVNIKSMIALPSGGNTIGAVTQASGPWTVQNEAVTSGGATPYHLVSAASTNATSLKASAGQVYMITAFNTNASIRYLKLFNKASAPTLGTDTPVAVFGIPGNTTGAGNNVPIPSVGLNFSTGIAFAITGGIADTDATAISANDVVISIGYN